MGRICGVLVSQFNELSPVKYVNKIGLIKNVPLVRFEDNLN